MGVGTYILLRIKGPNVRCKIVQGYSHRSYLDVSRLSNGSEAKSDVIVDTHKLHIIWGTLGVSTSEGHV